MSSERDGDGGRDNEEEQQNNRQCGLVEGKLYRPDDDETHFKGRCPQDAVGVFKVTAPPFAEFEVKHIEALCEHHRQQTEQIFRVEKIEIDDDEIVSSKSAEDILDEDDIL